MTEWMSVLEAEAPLVQFPIFRSLSFASSILDSIAYTESKKGLCVTGETEGDTRIFAFC